MDKETLSNYGWIVICVLVLAVMIALATPFGSFIADGFKATYTGLFQTGDNALNVGLSAVGVKNTYDCGHDKTAEGDHSQKECGHYACEDCGCVPASCGVEGHWSGNGKEHGIAVSNCYSGHTYTCECTSGWTVPEDGTYFISGTGNYYAGEQLPCGYLAKTFDTYTDSYYKYTKHVTTADGVDGWQGVPTDKTLEHYGDMYSEIAGKPVIVCNFQGCTSIVSTPVMSNHPSAHHNFRGCTTLESATIPDGVTSLNSGAFGNCSSLKSISLPNSLVTIDTQAFLGCTALESITIPDGVESIKCQTFFGCTNLRDIDLGKGIKTIESGAFYNCNKLTSLTIPSSVTTIGGNGSMGIIIYCTSLKEVHFENPTGWTAGNTQLNSEDLSNPTTAKTYLYLTYQTVVWNRS